MSGKRQEIEIVKGINKENSFTKFYVCLFSLTSDIRGDVSQKFSVNIWNLLWLSTRLITCTEQTSIYISTFSYELTSKYLVISTKLKM